jgi:hypothetical protein
MARKRNPIKQIMSEVHKDARAGKVELSEHGGFIAEVTRRARAAGVADDELEDLASPRRHGLRDERKPPGGRQA